MITKNGGRRKKSIIQTNKRYCYLHRIHQTLLNHDMIDICWELIHTIKY